MLRAFARIIEEVQPDIISMENVPRVAIHPALSCHWRDSYFLHLPHTCLTAV
ncbi:MAG: hypothetical protein EOO38_25865 [Cytophagaceae bacterium]|nr:MAG: hypothetical protein EOO38_25865 [Cytophagaceae bacterium]